VERLKHPQKLGDRLGEPDSLAVSFLVLHDGWIDDLVRLHSSIGGSLGHDWEFVVIDNPVDDDASERIAALDHVVHVPLRDRLGFAAGRNLAFRLARGHVVCVIDTSVELTGPLDLSALDDPEVGLLGKWGVRTAHGFHFEESEGPDVHAVEGYFMALRRADVRTTGLFDPKFKWYRNADLDLSFQVRAAGFRTVVDPKLQLVRHEHRQWMSTPEAERDELSRKNFFRFRDHWVDRPELFT
jgi:O-antigen biosynthesis protein